MPAPELQIDDVLTLIAAKADGIVRLTDTSGAPDKAELAAIVSDGKRLWELCQHLTELIAPVG